MWNTLYINAALQQLEQEGFEIQSKDIARPSPLVFEHINVLGRYSFSLPEAVSRGELRPLRNAFDAFDEITWHFPYAAFLPHCSPIPKFFQPVGGKDRMHYAGSSWASLVHMTDENDSDEILTDRGFSHAPIPPWAESAGNYCCLLRRLLAR
jgi:hypothetical protein